MSDAETRQRQRAMWATGDLPDIATMIVDVAEVPVEAADPQPEQDVLDVATGTGNVAIPMAQRGARRRPRHYPGAVAGRPSPRG